MAWEGSLHIALSVCKIAGTVGAFLGFTQSIHASRKSIGWRKYVPVALVFLAVSAEVIDVDLKRIEAKNAAAKELAEQQRDERLLYPFRRVTVMNQLLIPMNAIKAADPEYAARVTQRMQDGDLSFRRGYAEVPATDRLLAQPTGPAKIAATAFYKTDLSVYRREGGERVLGLWLMATPGANYSLDWTSRSYSVTEEYPPKGRRYFVSKDGVGIMDSSVSAEPSQVTDKTIRTIGELANQELEFTVCPSWPGNAPPKGALELASKIDLYNLRIDFDGVGVFQTRKLGTALQRQEGDGCVIFSYRFPDKASLLNEIQ